MSDALIAWKHRVDAYWDGLLVTLSDENGSYDPFLDCDCYSCGAKPGPRHQVFWEQAVRKYPYNVGDDWVCPDCALYIANGDLPTHLDD